MRGLVRTIQALMSAVASPEPSSSMDIYQSVELIKALQNEPGTDIDDLFRIEWAYLQLLDGHYGVSSKLLENRLSSTPDFFCEVIRLLYRSKNESKSEKVPTEQEAAIAKNAYLLLHEWQTPPGTQPDGSLSVDAFRQWLETTKAISVSHLRLEDWLTHILMRRSELSVSMNKKRKKTKATLHNKELIGIAYSYIRP